ncbi:AAA family ATPase [Albirhodobacter sp. R86504]|uniref:AAA family ATPase n=1 Tax=Albirhodobacter sp. R86504 TaxID=3093848 RepID=UPI0036713F71
MPQSNTKLPTWVAYADTLIGRLRRHHGVSSSTFSGTGDTEDDSSDLEEIFAKFESGKGVERFATPTDQRSRYIPARQLLTAFRLAASFRSQEIELQSRQCGALTVLRDIPLADLTTLKDTLTGCFPRSGWQVVAPDVTEGVLAKNAQDRFSRAIAESLDRIEPVLLLQTGGITLPQNLLILAPPILRLEPINQDVLTTYIESGHLSDQIGNLKDLRVALPTDAALAELSTADACAALRAPSLQTALLGLNEMTKRDAQCGPRLEDMTGDSPALLAARRIVADLVLWRQGKADWQEISRSLLLFGPPGTGKTWLARAMGNSAGINTVTGGFGEWQSAGHLGDMLREMRASFAEARKRAPCLLIIDEIDAVGSRSDADRHASNYRTQVISTFLAELDAISREEGVIVVGTCNHPDRMDPAILRAGRMDIKIKVPLPDADALLAILRHHLVDDIADGELRSLVPLAVGHSAAELDAAIRAARSDARHSRKMLNIAMLREHLNTGPSGQNAPLLWRIAVHEAGHAVIGAALNLGRIDSIQITADGGSILRQPVAHQGLLADIEAEMAYSLAGRAAEHLIFHEISAGSGGPESSDLAKATRYALDIETTYGLGHEGLVWHAKPNDALLTSPAISDRVRQRLVRAERRAAAILTRHRTVLEALAQELLQKRSMRAAAIEPFLRKVGQSKAPETATTYAEEVAR